jgi:TolB-like protein
MRRTLRVGALIALVGLACLANAASADEGKAALLPFQGPQASKVRQNVQKGLRAEDVQLVPLKQVTAVAKKTKGYAKQAARLGASALIRTRIRRIEGRWIADVEVRNAKGQRVEKVRTSSSSITRLSNRIVGQLLKTGRMPFVTTASAAAATPEPKSDEPPAPTQPRLVVRPFTGAQAGKIRGAAVRGLRTEPVELFPNKRFVDKANSLGVDLKSEGAHVAPAKSLGVSGLVEGDVLREDGVWSAYVRLVDSESATVISQHFYDASTAAALAKSVQTNIGPDLRKDIRKLGVVAPVTVGAVSVAADKPSEKKRAKEKEKEQKAKASKSRAADRPAAVDIGVDFRMVHRKFEYNDDLTGDLRDYGLKLGPGVGIKFQYFPGAHFTSGVGAQFGIDFEWERLFKVDSTRPDGQSFPTESQQFLVGLRWRYPTRRWEPYVVLDYGTHNFRFGLSGPPVPGEDNTAGIPSVDYRFVRLGTGFRVEIGAKNRFIIATGIAFRGVFSVGGIGSDAWFPEAKANGMDAMLMLGFALPKGFEIRLGADYRRYWFDLNPVPPPPPPPYVAGGALDQYIAGSIGVAWRW